MQINEILTLERTLYGVPGGSKKRVLEYFSKFIAQQIPALDSEEVFSRLIAREKLGSTGIGEGVALPHCRISHCKEAIGTFIRLRDKIDFDAIDGQPVDLIFLLLVPEEANEAHLQTLANLAETFAQDDVRKSLRKTDQPEELYQLLTTQKTPS
ncbi:PTS IIA-like nitrogen-regulatory protein PtsN [Marinospirillum celere]|uniref:PTS IIA-like nitrogen-regulatory protein PtsN n=1 Tax=Marinospirillum celere TaxID=1122252 RepID=A0A1I1FXQ6_9GAMM|nr:PTS IIA-like nitrogen regulatory protein PtsN [Marinospirillum celere]SFC03846.1 PTS IIA-like nitrogen-regulatory protein PtsN [Marinospirillum celere]